MHIAMIGQKGIPARLGGIERHVEELSARLVRRGITVSAYTRPWYTPAGKRMHRGVRLISLSSIATKHFDAITHTLRATVHAMRSDADVLHFHGVGPSLLAWMPRLFTPEKRVIATFHCIDRRHEKWGVLARTVLALGEYAACRFAHETIAVSRTLQHYVENLYRRDVRYIPNGVSPVGEPSKAQLKEMGLTAGTYFLVVTRFVRHKGVHTVLAAWQRVQDLPAFRGQHLVLVGGASFGDSYTKEISDFAGTLKRVHLLGVKEGNALATLYTYAKAFVHASVSEGLPIVVLEAMQHGAPVIASDIPEHMELVREYGMSFAAGDVRALATALRRLVQREDTAREKAKLAKRWVQKEYNWEDIAQETVRAYGEPVTARMTVPVA